MPSERALQRATELARLIGRVRRINRDRISVVLAERGESLHEWQVVANVKWQGPMTQGALADHIGTHAASVSRLIDGLEEKGLVRRVGDSKDRRRIAVQLTAKGSAWYEKTHAAPMSQLHAVMSRLNRAEQAELERLLLKLIA